MTINSNAVRAAWAKRTQATNYKQPLATGEHVIGQLWPLREKHQPIHGGTGSLLGSASRISTQWLAGSRITKCPLFQW
jgi:hypothetical protein